MSNQETLKQALANIRLDSLSLSPEVESLIKIALTNNNIDTEDIKQLLLSRYIHYKKL